MEYLDFSSVITTIRKYINNGRTGNLTPPFPMRSKTSWPPAIPVKPTGRKLTLLLRCCFSVWSVNSGSVMQIPKIF